MNSRLQKAVLGAGALGLMGGLVCVRPAAAQTTVTVLPVRKPFRIGLGIALPTDGDKDAVFSAGLGYDFAKSTSTNPLIGGAYLDYYGKNNQNVIGGGVLGRYLFAPATAPAQFYAGAGIGVYGNHVSGGSTKTNIGGKLLAGYQLNQGPFAEVDYTVTQKNNGVNPNAFNLRLGYRF